MKSTKTPLKLTLLVITVGSLPSSAYSISAKDCLRSVLSAGAKTTQFTARGIGWVFFRKDDSLAKLKTPIGGLFTETAQHHRNVWMDWMGPEWLYQWPSRQGSWAWNLMTQKKRVFDDVDVSQIIATIEQIERTPIEKLEVSDLSFGTMDYLQLEFAGLGRSMVPKKIQTLLVKLTETPPELRTKLFNRTVRKLPRRTYDLTLGGALLRRLGAKNLAEWMKIRKLRLPFRIVVDGSYFSMFGLPYLFAPAAIWIGQTWYRFGDTKAKEAEENDIRFRGKSRDEIEAIIMAQSKYFELTSSKHREMLSTDAGQEISRFRQEFEIADRLYQAQLNAKIRPEDLERLKSKRDALATELKDREIMYEAFLTLLVMQETIGLQVPDPESPELTQPWSPDDAFFAQAISAPFQPLFLEFRKKYLGSLSSLVWPQGRPPQPDYPPQVLFEPDYKGPTGASYFEHLQSAAILPLFREEMHKFDEFLTVQLLPIQLNSPVSYIDQIELLKATHGHRFTKIVESMQNTEIWKALAPKIKGSETKARAYDLKNALIEYRTAIHALRQRRILDPKYKPAPKEDSLEESSIEAEILKRYLR